MVLMNKFTGANLVDHRVDMWVAHYDIGENETVIMLGDIVLEKHPGNMNMDMCQDIVDATWEVIPCDCAKNEYVINDDKLKESVIDMIAENLEVPYSAVEGLVDDGHCSDVVSAMYDAQSDAVWKLSDEIRDKLDGEPL